MNPVVRTVPLSPSFLYVMRGHRIPEDEQKLILVLVMVVMVQQAEEEQDEGSVLAKGSQAPTIEGRCLWMRAISIISRGPLTIILLSLLCVGRQE